ncbi:MAG TPA: hypothetical protein VLB45_03065 [Nitrosopumilaceae archaeon]|nr:hypothetical protein [Nitrosopumilaceae archaeon]
MIGKEELDRILLFVAKRWTDMSRDPKNKAFESLPSGFWMNSVGGSAGPGKWITMLMYTEDESEAASFKEVLLRWQSKHAEKPSDLIQINKK